MGFVVAKRGRYGGWTPTLGQQWKILLDLEIVQLVTVAISLFAICRLHHDVFLVKLVLYQKIPVSVAILYSELSTEDEESHNDDNDEEAENDANDLLKGESISSPRQ